MALFPPSYSKNLQQKVSRFLGLPGGLWGVLGAVNVYVLLALLKYLHSNALTVTNISIYIMPGIVTYIDTVSVHDLI